MRKGYNIDTLTSVDIQEIVEVGGKVIHFYESGICQENSRKSPFGKVIEKLIDSRQKIKMKEMI